MGHYKREEKSLLVACSREEPKKDRSRVVAEANAFLPSFKTIVLSLFAETGRGKKCQTREKIRTFYTKRMA